MNAEILTSVFTRWRRRLKVTAVKVTASEEDADDILQEAFARLWQQRERYMNESHAVGAAMTTVRHLAVDTVRRRERQQCEALDAVADSEADSDETGDTIERVMAVIETELTERQQRVLMMRDKWEWEMADIAEALGVTEANARLILSRARRAVRECYRKISDL